jgi:hypothetical protein
MYNHVILPLLVDPRSDNNNNLYLFEDSETKLVLTPKLPKLPDLDTTGNYYVNVLNKIKTDTGRIWKLRINKSDTFKISTSVSGKSYSGFLPASLFMVLNEIAFSDYNLINNGKPLMYADWQGHYTNKYWYDSSIDPDTLTTPGGI